MKIRITTPSRLHMGLIDLNGGLGRVYGSIGCAIDHPNVVLEAEPHSSLLIRGKRIRKVRSLAERVLKHFSLDIGVQIEVKETIPEHVGLGSGTQLSLAVGTALTRLAGLEVATSELATIMGRGAISGIGTVAFDKGGFIVDGGHRLGSDRHVRAGPIPTILRYNFPNDWLFIIAIPEGKRGLSGREEMKAFQTLPTASPERVGEICRMILMKMLPALIEEDIGNFGEALTEVQALVGDTFRHAQKDRFMNAIVGECVDWMLRNGAYGAGQSSWGPTVYGLVRGNREGDRLMEGIREFLKDRIESEVFCASVNNSGAQFKIIN